MIEYTEIRNILSRWYQGDASPAEQQRLRDFFSVDCDLPEDLAMERAMFRAMSAVDECDVDIPEDLSDRIENALRTEMARERNSTALASRWRRRILAACGAAACLVAGMTIYSLVSTDHYQKAPDARMAMAVTVPADIPPADPDTALTIRLDPVSKPSARVAQAPAIARRSSRKVKQPVEAVKEVKENVSETDMYLSEAEEQLLIADNYHIVRDEREADAILSSVFVRLEGGMVEESYRINDINAEYEMEMTKLYN